MTTRILISEHDGTSGKYMVGGSLRFFIQQCLFSCISSLLPDSRRCGYKRAALLRASGASVGGDCWLCGSLKIQHSFRQLTIGDDVFINTDCCFDLSAPIQIGNRVRIGFQVALVTGTHEIGPHECRAGADAPRSIQIEDGAWIGARATVLPGVTIGAGAVVASGAVVTKNVAPDTLVAGVPAKPLRALEP